MTSYDFSAKGKVGTANNDLHALCRLYNCRKIHLYSSHLLRVKCKGHDVPTRAISGLSSDENSLDTLDLAHV